MTAKSGWLGSRACKTFRAPAVKFFALSAIILVGLAPLATCGGGGTAAGIVTSVTVSPSIQNVELNQSVNFMAAAQVSNSTTPVSTAVTWEVNGLPGGGSASQIMMTGSIVPDPANPQVGIYTAPSAVPASDNGQVNITAVAPQNPSNPSDNNTVTSNIAVAKIGGGAGLAVSPATTTVAAGSTFGFSATLNTLPYMNVTWSISSTNGGDIGVIAPNGANGGNYTAPSFPPPGAMVTVTATDNVSGATATATATITYSDASFKHAFAFSYTGNDSLGFLAVTGSLVADGAGCIVSGVEDIQSFTTGISEQVQIFGGVPCKSNYLVGPDGRTKVTLNSGLPSASTLQFALTNNLHGQLIRFDANATGGGTIDQQTVTDLSNLNSGFYVFSLLGVDAAFKPLGMAGRLSANGAGQFTATGSILDINDNGTVTVPPDTTLAGSYSFDSTFPGTGRGTLTLTSSTIDHRQFAFYVVNGTLGDTHLRLVEIDGISFLAGDLYSAAPGSPFTLAAANYAFTAGGMSPTGVYAGGGIFISDGNGNTTAGGAFDSNNAGMVTTNTTIDACTYSIDQATGRIVLLLNIGACSIPSGANPNTLEYAMYQTANGSAVMLELDGTAVSTGMAFQQAVTPTLATGGFALNLVGQGLLHGAGAPASIQQVLDGQVTLSGTSVTSGTIDINNFPTPFPNDPLNGTGATSPSSFTAPAANGRGTAVLAASNPGATYNLSYYLIDDNTALLFDLDKTVTAIGAIGRQF